MKYEDIKFFSERCEEHPDHQTGMVSHQMIQDRLSEEVDELRAYIESQLAQPEQEPVAIRYDFDGYGYQYIDSGSGSDWQTRVQGEPLYTAPHSEQYPQIAISPEIVGYVAPQRTWVGLTNGEMIELSEMKLGSWDLILEVEDKLRSKNNG